MAVRGGEKTVYVAPDWEFDPGTHCLRQRQSGRTEDLGPQCARVLELLCRCHGETVTRARFIDEIWDGNYAVGDRGLRQDIWRIRKALEVGGEDRQLVTVPRTGYRLECEDLAVVPRAVHRRRRFGTRYMPILVLVLLALLVLTALRLALITDPAESPQAIALGVPFNQFDGLVETPALSADAARVAYAVRDEAGRWSIRIEAADGSGEIAGIGPDPQYKLLEPVFSPDGGRIAYLIRLESQRHVLEYRVVVHDLETGTGQTLARANGVQTIQPGLDWSHDGRYLLFPQAVEPDQLPIGIVQLDLESGRIRALTQPALVDIGPVYRPDSFDFSFTRLADAGGADLFASIGGQTRQLTDEYAFIHSHAWLDDDRFIVSMHRDAAYRAFAGRIGDTRLRKLDADPGFRSPAVDGNTVYWIRSVYSVGSRMLSLSDTADRWSLAPVGLVRKDPAIHPEKSLLAVIDDRSGFPEVWLCDFHGGNERQLTFARSRLVEPRWSPDGRMLVARLDDPASTGVRPVRIDMDTGELIEIVPPGVSLVGFQFTADSRFGAAIRPGGANTEVWRLSVNSTVGAKPVFSGEVERLWVFSGAEIGFLGKSTPRIIDLATGMVRTVSVESFNDRVARFRPRWQWQAEKERMVLLDHADPSSPTEVVSVNISSTPGYGFSVESRQGLAGWSEYFTLRKRLYRSTMR